MGFDSPPPHNTFVVFQIIINYIKFFDPSQSARIGWEMGRRSR